MSLFRTLTLKGDNMFSGGSFLVLGESGSFPTESGKELGE